MGVGPALRIARQPLLGAALVACIVLAGCTALGVEVEPQEVACSVDVPPITLGSSAIYEGSGAMILPSMPSVMVEWWSDGNGNDDQGVVQFTPGSRLAVALADKPGYHMDAAGQTVQVAQATYWVERGTSGQRMPVVDESISMVDGRSVALMNRNEYNLSAGLVQDARLTRINYPALLLATAGGPNEITVAATGEVFSRHAGSSSWPMINITLQRENEMLEGRCVEVVSYHGDLSKGRLKMKVNVTSTFMADAPWPISVRSTLATEYQGRRDRADMELRLAESTIGGGLPVPQFNPPYTLPVIATSEPFDGANGITACPAAFSYDDMAQVVRTHATSRQWFFEHPGAFPVQMRYNNGDPNPAVRRTAGEWLVVWQDGTSAVETRATRSYTVPVDELYEDQVLVEPAVVTETNGDLPSAKAWCDAAAALFGSDDLTYWCDPVEELTCSGGTHAATGRMRPARTGAAISHPGLRMILEPDLIPMIHAVDASIFPPPVPAPWQ